MGGTTKKKNITNSVTDPLVNEVRQSHENQNLATSGVGGTVLFEGVPIYINSLGEHVIEGQNNCYIVMGRDRPGHMGTGYGGLGDTGAGSIDFVVGRPGNDSNYVNPSFEHDSARIHVSQKTDVDRNFNLARGTDYSSSESAIGIKADAIRLVGRRSVKIVAGAGSDVQNYGIDVIANNDDGDLQPMVKGDNLVQAMNQLIEDTNSLIGIIQAYGMAQDTWNSVLMTMIKNSPFWGALTIPMQHHIEQGADCIMKHAQDMLDKSSSSKLKAKLKAKAH